jgi:flagellar hook protein FlgE
MPMYGLFTSPILGMLAQTSALGSISQNISNMNTGGYKAHDTKFSTVLASTYSNSRDIGGLTANTRNFIEQQGRIISSTSGMDLAISGKGLYVLNTEVDGSGDTLYTRDGGFEIKSGDEATNGAGNIYNEGYVVDKNGYYLQGWVADGSGSVSTAGALQSIRVDSEAFNSGGAADATASASVAANLPVTTAVGGTQSTKASIFDSNGDTQTFELIWTRNAANQEWTMTVSPDSGTSSSTQTFTFDSSGGLPDGTTTSVTITDLSGGATTFNLDISDVTSIGDQFLYFDFQKDGRTSGELDSFKFDAAGKVIGLFTNGLEQTLYKLPLATFVNGDGLDRIQGNLFQTSVTSGGPTLVEVRAENSSVDIFHEFAHFVPFSHELSNTNLQNEFSHMIMTQQAYNSAATVFKTVDEMTSQAANLKT